MRLPRWMFPRRFWFNSLPCERARVNATLAYWDRQFESVKHRDPMEPLDVEALTRGAYEAGDAAYEACARGSATRKQPRHFGSKADQV